ncbi:MULTISPECIES: hypothetical protein [Lacticaseibacillus]|uniref:hypothetical protein n=1 Tax=Lacticaseibacillus TaxID=2759736 RepID=UPI0008A3491A|nr:MULTISPECIES: hypothetical protein [Lacticaseibacillus]MDE3282840.1 hypothetical protein [Lacticaseibacillus casei]MDE3315640.1 hypothetical protein [Lacticaseibacillus zeae]OFS00539.1 hypothetical protein HMPREF2861_00500 [Lactobacillus sp. HMSC068F07]WLV87471.1 hypothetical protein LACZS1_001197 [Lacticaseibacillus sp. NCIMB 15474]
MNLEKTLLDLQNLKFEIFISAKYGIDYHCFKLLTLELPDKSINLADLYHLHKSMGTKALAHQIVADYNL